VSAVAGVWSRGGTLPPLALCDLLLEAQARLGSDDTSSRQSGPVAFGRRLHQMLAEDRFDRQPLQIASEGLLLVADVRIDNRSELLAALDLPHSAPLADSEILLRGWSRWRSGLLDRLLGDFAFAVWDGEAETLTLARDPLGERPLHYCEAPGLFAFATASAALTMLPGMAGGADPDALADFVADLPRRGPRSFHRGVKRVEPGHIVVADRAGTRTLRWWDPRGPEIRLPRPADYGEALRNEIDGAVRRRLRRARGEVGSHLSAGLDSGAVTSAAASILADRGERLHAFTSAPRSGFDGRAPTGYVSDESDVAARVAVLYPNLDHVVVRPPPGLSPLPLLARDHALAGQPIGHVVNNLWWSAINESAQARGVSVMLTGEAGNFTLSAGLALDDLADMLRRGWVRKWLLEARALAGQGYGWKTILNASFGGYLPPRFYSAFRRLLGNYVEAGEDLGFVAAGRKAGVATRGAGAGWEVRPSPDSKGRRWRMLQLVDPGNYRKRSLAAWGIEERDPTADARLVRFCFSLPPEALLDGGVRRPALRAALAGRLPAASLDSPIRGFQGADWHERIGGEALRAFVAPFSAAASDVVDFAALEAAARNWPTGDFHDRANIYFFDGKCLRAAAAAHFLAANR
jgi:asparagine synthase (glutamine-hydrolysing)